MNGNVKLLAVLLSGTILCAGFSGCVNKKKEPVPELVFRYAENQAEDFPTTLGAYKFAQLAAEKTGGRIRIEVYPNARLGSEVQTIEQLRFGGIDFARVSLSQLAETAPSLGVLQLPYLYRDEEHMWRVLDGEIGDSFLNSLAGNNIIGLSWYNAGSRSFYTTEPIKTPGDLKGRVIRVQESAIMADMVRLLGAIPTPIVYSDVYSALKTGGVDGAENNWPSYESTSHYQVARYFYMNEHARVPEMQVISRAALEKLSPQDFEIIQECAKASALFQREEWSKREARSEEICKADGVLVTTPNEKELLFMKEMCKPLYAQYAADYTDILEKIIELGED